MAIWTLFAKVGSATVVSRILGFIRDAMIAGALGTGPVADAFVVAFRLPNLVRRLFAEGAFNSAFVPLYTRIRHEDGEASATRLVGEIASTLMAAALLFTSLAILAAPWLVDLIAIGFRADARKFDLAVTLTRICLPYLACMSIIGLLGGVLSAHRRYLAQSLVPIVLNVVLITALTAISVAGLARSETAGTILAVGVAISGACQLLLVGSAVWRAGLGFTLRIPAIKGPIATLMARSLPALVGGGITQINIVIGSAVASLKAGAVSNLYYADRIYQLPLGVIGIAIGLVLLPELLHRIRIGRQDLAIDTQNRSFEFALGLTLPAAVGLMVAARPIVEVLFERGAFGPRDTDLTASALTGFAVGLPAFVIVKVLSAAFFARMDLKTPLWTGLIAIAVNLALAISLFPRFGGTGVAAAISAAGWIHAGLLWVILLRRGDWRADGPLEHRVPRFILASTAMGIVVWVLRYALDGWLGAENALAVKMAALAGLVGLGMAVFIGVGILIGAIDWPSIKAGLKRRQGEDAPGVSSTFD